MVKLQDSTQIEIWDQFIQTGDMELLSSIYSDNYDLLYDYGLRYSSDIQIVEDSIQEVFVNIIKYRKNISFVKNVKGYLIASFRRKLFLELNKKNKTISTETLPDGFFDYFKCSDCTINNKEDLEFLYSTINECISKLSSKQKEMIFLRFEREIPYDEIASILNISVDSCYKSIYRIIKILRQAAEDIVIKSGKIIFGFSSDQISKMKSQGN